MSEAKAAPRRRRRSVSEAAFETRNGDALASGESSFLFQIVQQHRNEAMREFDEVKQTLGQSTALILEVKDEMAKIRVDLGKINGRSSILSRVVDIAVAIGVGLMGSIGIRVVTR